MNRSLGPCGAVACRFLPTIGGLPRSGFNVESFQLSRRTLLTAAGAGVLAASLPIGTGFGLSPAVAADNQTNLRNLVQQRFGMFNHFNLGTFTNEEWAAGGQSPTKFAPPSVDCAQWAAAAAAATMTYGVLTTKHHDGFCLWPTAYGNQNVANSGYKQDVVRQYVDAFRAKGLRVGLYFSIWDRTKTVEAYGGHHVKDTTLSIDLDDINYTLGQVRELLTNYGEIDIFITDGYAWQMGQHAVPYQRLRALVQELQPNCAMIDHGGMSQPWLGDAIYFEEPLGIRAPAGNTYAGVQGQTVSNGWFWHPTTPGEALMSRDDIINHLTDLEPKYTSFLLNCPPNRNGRLDTNIVNRLAEVGAAWAGPNASRAPLPAQPLKVEYPVTAAAAYASAYRQEEPPRNVIDGKSDVGQETCWSTWGGTIALPQAVTIALGGVWSNVSTLQYLPKQWNRSGNTNGDITGYKVSVSTDGNTFTQVANGTWAADPTPKIAEWPGRNVAYVRLEATAATGGYANVNGLNIGGRLSKPALVSRPVEEGRAYRLVNRKSGKVLDVYNFGTANGSNVQQYTWSGAACQKFTFTSVGDGYFSIKDSNSGKLVEVAGLSRIAGGNVAIWGNAGTFPQHWALTQLPGGYVALINRFSGLAMTVDGASTANEANVDQDPFLLDNTHQHWQLIAS